MRAAAPIGLVALLALLLVGCASGVSGIARAGASPSARPTLQVPDDRPLRVAVVGDSITAVASHDFAHGEIDPQSWVAQLDTGDELRLVGGWAVRGATTTDMAAGVGPVDADVLILLAGANDIRKGVTIAETRRNLASIASTVGAPIVVLSAITPQDDRPTQVTAFNTELTAFAAERGWVRIDATGPLRDGDRFRAGLTSDGLHPSAEGERLLGQEIRRLVQRATGSSTGSR